jgi:NodT family efflux transporter outer membrane factor (OMF) lipoprotein
MRQESESNEMEKKRSDLEQSRRKLENKIAILLGRAPGELKIPDTKNSRPPEIIQVPPGLPSELLANRPDIIAAEYRVEKAYHQIGEARAARLPSISLSGQAGFASATLSTLLQQWTLGLTPLINFPVFDGGASKIRVERNKIQADIAEKEYRQTVFRAFEEVENTLMELASRHQQKNILEKKRDILKVIYAQTDEKLQMGLITQQELMDIQREFLNTEKTLLETERSLLDNTVKLCKALGGGWSRSDIRDTDISEPQYTEQTGESGRQDEKAEERKTVSLSDISPKVQIRRMRVQEIKG